MARDIASFDSVYVLMTPASPQNPVGGRGSGEDTETRLTKQRDMNGKINLMRGSHTHLLMNSYALSTQI